MVRRFMDEASSSVGHLSEKPKVLASIAAAIFIVTHHSDDPNVGFEITSKYDYVTWSNDNSSGFKGSYAVYLHRA